MMRIRKLEHRFVRSVPRELEPGILYVSMEYGTAVHSCCCGCGEQVVTPFSPTDWKMTYDGESISLTPSVGNWYSGCRSHYIVRQGRVIEAESWSQAQIEAEHRRDVAAKATFYSDKVAVGDAQASTPGNPAVSVAEGERPSQSAGGFWSSVAAWLLGRESKK
ncbi:DUF6527 family protein [Burkholderia pseudomallei]|uniref:DUF6527 family protein n=2 Tax=Burkholderia pseudomallei TaxID=28450 RepID=UPI000977424B|nr:DUF6527 family protein [Burkholderia pseudomallei]